MPWFGRGRGQGWGLGRGHWPGAGFGRRFGTGRGMGNPYPFCRFYPWLPRRWWAMGMTPYTVPSWGPYTPPPATSPGRQA